VVRLHEGKRVKNIEIHTPSATQELYGEKLKGVDSFWVARGVSTPTGLQCINIVAQYTHSNPPSCVITSKVARLSAESFGLLGGARPIGFGRRAEISHIHVPCAYAYGVVRSPRSEKLSKQKF
jgi:hypothetical protein